MDASKLQENKELFTKILINECYDELKFIVYVLNSDGTLEELEQNILKHQHVMKFWMHIFFINPLVNIMTMMLTMMCAIIFIDGNNLFHEWLTKEGTRNEFY